MATWDGELLEKVFSVFAKNKNKNGNLGWETLGDALTKLCLLITQMNKYMKP